jgi:hypothetical protein
VGSGFGKESSYSRREQLGFRKTVLTAHIEYKKGIVLKEGKSFLYPKTSIRNELLLEKKYLSMKDVFLVENHCHGVKDMIWSGGRMCSIRGPGFWIGS